jgi:hypothetical protein
MGVPSFNGAAMMVSRRSSASRSTSTGSNGTSKRKGVVIKGKGIVVLVRVLRVEREQFDLAAQEILT